MEKIAKQGKNSLKKILVVSLSSVHKILSLHLSTAGADKKRIIIAS